MCFRFILPANKWAANSIILSTGRWRRSLAPVRVRQYSSRRQSGKDANLTHIDETGRPVMVDVTAKEISVRSATACGRISVPVEALDLILSNTGSAERSLTLAQEKARRKGDVLTVAQLAAIMGCKKTSELIPLCHPLSVTKVEVSLAPDINTLSILCTATVKCTGQTGVEMEALTAVTIGLLTVWDMLKAVAGQEMTIGDIKVIAKAGGKTDYKRDT